MSNQNLSPDARTNRRLRRSRRIRRFYFPKPYDALVVYRNKPRPNWRGMNEKCDFSERELGIFYFISRTLKQTQREQKASMKKRSFEFETIAVEKIALKLVNGTNRQHSRNEKNGGTWPKKPINEKTVDARTRENLFLRNTKKKIS